MQKIVIDKPYVPVPPYRGRLWPWILSLYVPRLLRRKYGIVRVDCVNGRRLRESIAAGHGVLLAPNHCRDEDPLVLGQLSRAVGKPFFIMASWHVFMQDRVSAFLLNRAGAFSIYREGIDRVAVDTAIDILEKNERPMVMFPEGIIARTNDHLNPLMEGVALIARTAAKKRAKQEPPGKLVVHPVAIRYHFHGDIDAALTSILDEIEARLSWQPQKHLSRLDRIYKVGSALLTLKELEYTDHPQPGDIAQRLQNLIDLILNPLEEQWASGKHDGSVTARVKRLRSAILPEVIKGELDEAELARRWRQLADVYLAQQLWLYPPDYVRSNPSAERLLETVERFEEDLTDKVRVHGPMSATVTVGEAIEVSPQREARGSADPLLVKIEEQLRQMLGLDAPKHEEPPATAGKLRSEGAKEEAKRGE
jgi:1-acyl-sn-glycerol-3-phosphate acyltransferase